MWDVANTPLTPFSSKPSPNSIALQRGPTGRSRPKGILLSEGNKLMTRHKLEQQPFVLSSDLPLHPPSMIGVQVPVLPLILKQLPLCSSRFHSFSTSTSQSISKEWDPPTRGPRFHFYHTVCSLVTQLQQIQEDEICTALERNCWTFLWDHVLSVSVLTCHLTTQACATTSNL